MFVDYGSVVWEGGAVDVVCCSACEDCDFGGFGGLRC